MLLGAAFSALGQYLSDPVFFLRAGALLILLGLSQWGILRVFPLQQEFRFHFKKPLVGIAGWFLAGVTFAFGWTPCVGPILGLILTLAGTSGQIATGVWLLLVYSLGLATPFFLMALAYRRFYFWSKKISRYARVSTFLSGLLLVGVGVLLFTDRFTLLSMYLNRIFGGRSLEDLLWTK